MSAYSSAVLALSPYLYWRLGASGTTDQSGNGRNGTANGGVTVGGAASLLPSDTADGATSFDGVDDHVVVSAGTHNMANATVACWVQFTSNPASNKLCGGFADGLGSTTNDKDLYIDSSGRPAWHVYDGINRDITGSALTTSAPHFLVGTCNSSVMNLYADGSQVATFGTIGASFTGYTVPNIFASGSTSVHGPFNFIADEFAIWNSALTAAQIAGLYSAASLASPKDVLLRGVG